MTLGARLSATYAAVLLFSLLLFAAAAVVAIDRTLHSALDARLATDAGALASLIDVHNGEVVADEEDRRQFLSLISTGDQGLVADRDGRIKLSSVTQPPAAVLALPSGTRGYFTVGTGAAAVRAFVFPLIHHGRRAGTVIVWRAGDWIAQTDFSAAAAFLVAALIIAILALVAGGAVTRRALADAFARQRRFTADASHELRAPLAVIRAEADLALRRERSAADYHAAMETIAAESDRMETLIEDLLSVARAEGGHSRRERVDLADLVRSVASRLEPAAAAKDARLQVNDDSNTAIIGDRHAIERAFLAVGHNAVKYAPAHGTIVFDVRRRRGVVEAAVRDNGPGFSSDALQHATDRFWHHDADGVRAGSGLGLAIARSIVEGAGGAISLENAPAQGAVVRLRFPAAPRSG